MFHNVTAHMTTNSIDNISDPEEKLTLEHDPILSESIILRGCWDR